MKSIILCADGTWNTPHGDSQSTIDTNVRKLYCSLTNDRSQLKYYDSGVGTDGTPLDHLFGGAMGEGLFQKVQDCYQFLSNVYDPGDRIFVFGFSRGAYTARSGGYDRRVWRPHNQSRQHDGEADLRSLQGTRCNERRPRLLHH